MPTSPRAWPTSTLRWCTGTSRWARRFARAHLITPSRPATAVYVLPPPTLQPQGIRCSSHTRGSDPQPHAVPAADPPQPQNVLLDRHGTAKIADFGISRWAPAACRLGTMRTQADACVKPLTDLCRTSCCRRAWHATLLQPLAVEANARLFLLFNCRPHCPQVQGPAPLLPVCDPRRRHTQLHGARALQRQQARSGLAYRIRVEWSRLEESRVAPPTTHLNMRAGINQMCRAGALCHQAPSCRRYHRSCIFPTAAGWRRATSTA